MKNDDLMDPEEFLVGDTKTIYTQGNWTQLRASMAEYCGVESPKCIYFGDHLIQDVLAAGRLDRVDSVAILEELEVEDPIVSINISNQSWLFSNHHQTCFTTIIKFRFHNIPNEVDIEKSTFLKTIFLMTDTI